MLFNKFEDIPFADFEQAVNEATEPNQGMDFTCHPSKIEAVQQDERVINFDGVQVKCEDRAIRYLYTRFGAPYFPAENGKGKSKGLDYSMMEAELFAPHWAAVLNTGAANLPEKTRKLYIRGTKGKDGSTFARAINTELYRPYDGRDALSFVKGVIGSVPGTIIKGAKIERDYTSGSMYFTDFDESLLPDELRGQFRVGIRVATGETGQAATSLRPAIWRGVCDNSFVLKGGGVNMKAMYSVDTINQVFADTLRGTFGFAVEFIRVFEESRGFKIPDLSSVMRGYCIANNLSKTVFDNAINGHEGQQNLYGLMNGITHAAKAESSVLADQMESDITSVLFQPHPYASDNDVDGNAKMYTWDMSRRDPVEIAAQIERWRYLDKEGKLKDQSVVREA